MMREQFGATTGFPAWRTTILVAVIAISGACGGDSESGAAGGPPGGPGGGEGGPPPMPVDVAVAMQDTVLEEIRATGQIEAVQSIRLQPEVSGRLAGIYASEGREVRRGAPLFKIDDSELVAQVARLEAQLDLAEQALSRTRDLLERNASSQADLEQAEATARSARADLQLQQTRLERTVVRAPFSGVVGERLVSVGDYITPQTQLTTLQTVDPQRATFRVPERYAGLLEVGQEVSFEVAAMSGRQFSGVVDFVDPRVQLPGRTITVKALVENDDRSLKPGMFIEARLVVDVRPEAVVIPEDAILPLSGQDFVWVATPEGTATRKEVSIGVRTSGFVEIREGISAGEQVVVGGVERLGEGAPVAPNVVERSSG
ncbi:MAG: efflux RND transporter periplasmic adaptor subunit [marine benthic group bacterium]|nr:efflux RND transporter periplasmic adaptor subunit [Gemmatimonadota bacterium]MCL7937360.1 efflux RND transporter periplasmic adaptor subunit [Gemmatimonadota bacterium]MCL7957486.1 efflux RND transporter periplasmic adaptor subunit [Gemmatimonadota bacterium]MCL7967176.1 efflux RND transporter periplasmic adaptor subunit [Gemmatimonadota bacterium]MCL7969659.1 efflux RND transporter periplasmic adaptor subunit [Gemmatimonadota bacterium]